MASRLWVAARMSHCGAEILLDSFPSDLLGELEHLRLGPHGGSSNKASFVQEPDLEGSACSPKSCFGSVRLCSEAVCWNTAAVFRAAFFTTPAVFSEHDAGDTNKLLPQRALAEKSVRIAEACFFLGGGMQHRLQRRLLDNRRRLPRDALDTVSVLQRIRVWETGTSFPNSWFGTYPSTHAPCAANAWVVQGVFFVGSWLALSHLCASLPFFRDSSR